MSSKEYNGMFIALAAITLSCNHSPEEAPLTLMPLSPYNYTFSEQKTSDRYRSHNEYYVLSGTGQEKDLFAKRSVAKIFAYHSLTKYPTSSVYIYNGTEILNKDFKGTRDSLKGIHDNDLFAYARWKKGKIDIFYLLKDGMVTYDILEKKTVLQRFEFD